MGNTDTAGTSSASHTSHTSSALRTYPVNSSWIKRLAYVPLAPGSNVGDERADGFLIIETKRGDKRAHLTPSWVVGLLCAAKSKGRAYGKLVRRRYPSVRLEN